MWRTHELVPLYLVGLLALGACGGGSEPSTEDARASGYPMTVRNCGLDVTIQKRPERAFMISDTPVSLLESVDGLDTVIGKTGPFPDELFSQPTAAALDKIPTVGGAEVDGRGHVQISLEALIAERPDLVLGYLPEESGITRERLAQVGIPVLVPPAFCEDPAQIPTKPTLDDVYGQVELYGQVFDAEDRATQEVADLRSRVTAVTDSVRGPTGRTAAALFVSPGGGAPSAYGKRSLVHAQLEAVGLSNVFSDVDERVFEPSVENIISKDPDVVVLLCVECPPGAIEGSFRAIPGVGGVTAVRNDDILVQRFRQTEPPSPLAVTGLENIAREFGGRR